VRTGLTVTLLGANFAPTPAGNIVHFDLPGQSWTANVTQAATNVLLVTVPTNLPTFGSVTGVLYRVTVTTSVGAGNGVGCKVFATTANTFMVRPNTAYITQPPGTGKQIFAVGGGLPPYSLVAQSSNDMNIAVASLTGGGAHRDCTNQCQLRLHLRDHSGQQHGYSVGQRQHTGDQASLCANF
jgi:hypothetical protein